MLSSPNPKSAELKEKYGYRENQLLKPEQINEKIYGALRE